MAFTLSKTGLTLTTKWRFVQFADWIYATNGVDTPLRGKWNGSSITWYTWGQAAPAAANLPGLSITGTTAANQVYSAGQAYPASSGTAVIGSNVTWGSYMTGGDLYVEYGTPTGTTISAPITTVVSTTQVTAAGAYANDSATGTYRIEYSPTAGNIVVGSTDTIGFALTWRDSTYGIETNPYYPTTTITGNTTGKPKYLSKITVAVTTGTFTCGNPAFDKIVLYRNLNAGDFHEDVEITASTASFQSTASTSVVAAGTLLQTDNTPPGLAYVPCVWDGRIWLCRVKADMFARIYSKVNEPDYFPTGNAMQTYAQHGKPIAQVPFGDQLILLTERKALVIRTGTTTYLEDEIPGSDGCVSPEAWAVVNTPETGRILVWLSQTQIMKYDGATAMSISDNISQWICGPDKLIDTTALMYAFAEVDMTHEEVRFSVRRPNKPKNDMEIVWCYGRASTPFFRDIGVERVAYVQMKTRDCGELRYFTDPYGNVWKEEDSYYFELGQDSGTQSGTVTSVSGTTLGDSTGAFTTSGDGQKGTWLYVRSTSGTISSGRVASNTATAFVVDSWIGGNPSVGSSYQLGAIDAKLKTQDLNLTQHGGNRWICERIQVETSHATSTDKFVVRTYKDKSTTASVTNTVKKDNQIYAVIPKLNGRYVSIEIEDANTDEDFVVNAIEIQSTETGRAH